MAKYRLEIKSGGPTTSPFSWVLHREGEEYPREKSRENFRTPLLAKMAGNKVLRELESQGCAEARKSKR